MPVSDHYTMFPCDPYQNKEWKKIEGLENCIEESSFCNEPILKVKPEALEKLAEVAFHDISHFLRTDHLQQLQKILSDPEASANDRFVALDLLRNSQIAAEGILPMCQDTGTAIIMAKKGRSVWTPGQDESALSKGIEKTYASDNLRFSQLAPLDMFEEKKYQVQSSRTDRSLSNGGKGVPLFVHGQRGRVCEQNIFTSGNTLPS